MRALVAVGFTTASFSGFAAGFYLQEVGSPGSLGTAGVVNATNDQGADSSWTNPAGMTGIDQQQIMAGIQLLVPSIKFDARSTTNEVAALPPLAGPVRGDNGGNAGEIAAVPSFFYVRPLSDRARFGFSLTGPIGGGVDYGTDFVGRYSVQRVTLAGAAITPSFAYRVSDRLSLGAGVSAIYTIMEQEVAIRQGAPDPALDGRIKFEELTDWGFQGILGLTYEFSDRLLLGLVYRSEADIDLEGDVKVEGLRIPLPAMPPSDVKISWTNPQWLDFGLRYMLSDDTALLLNAGWQEWSKFSQNRLSFDNGRVAELDRSWDDTWYLGAGAVHRLSERSKLAFGFSYDSSPVKDEFRTLDFPVDETWKLSAAYGWEQSDTLTFAVGTTLYFFGSAPLVQTSQGVTVRGDYDTNMFAIVGGTLRYDF
jgi:long-chain fatty acid transport protein